MHLDKPTLLEVHQVYAKCLNRSCKIKSFVLPIKGIEKYQKTTARFKKEAVDSIVLDNTTCEKVKNRIYRSFKSKTSRRTIDRWKQQEACRYTFKEIISALAFSGILCLDEIKPKRSNKYDLITADKVKSRILYLERVERRNYTHVRAYLNELKSFGIHPWLVIIDRWASFPRAIQKVWPKVLIQYDYFHIMQEICDYLYKVIKEHIEILKEDPLNKDLCAYLWKHKLLFLKNKRNLKKNKKQQEELAFMLSLSSIKESPVAKIPEFLIRIRTIFDDSISRDDACAKRNDLYFEGWHEIHPGFKLVMQMLMDKSFYWMTTYLEFYDEKTRSHIKLRAGNSETLNRTYRQMEKVRYGFKTKEGRQNHLKLYQVKHYLKEQI